MQKWLIHVTNNTNMISCKLQSLKHHTDYRIWDYKIDTEEIYGDRFNPVL